MQQDKASAAMTKRAVRTIKAVSAGHHIFAARTV